MTKKSTLKRDGGFTLMEVLVAIAIISIALPALLFTTMQYIDGTVYMKQRTIAAWVASNKMTEWQIANMERGKIPELPRTGSNEMAGSDWGWSVETEGTNRPFEYLVTVSVWFNDDPEQASLASLKSYLQDFDSLLKEEGYRQ